MGLFYTRRTRRTKTPMTMYDIKFICVGKVDWCYEMNLDIKKKRKNELNIGAHKLGMEKREWKSEKKSVRIENNRENFEEMTRVWGDQ